MNSATSPGLPDPPASPIVNEIDLLRGDINSLEEAIGCLVSKVGQFMAPEAPAEEAPQTMSDDGNARSVVGEHLRTLRSRVNGITSLVDETADRIE